MKLHSAKCLCLLRCGWSPSIGPLLLVPILLIQTVILSVAGENSAPAPPPSPQKSTNPEITRLEDGRYKVDAVVLDKEKMTLTMQAEVNMRSNIAEYLLVTGTGKLHESLLKSDVEAWHVHLAMLLLGVKGAMNAPPVDFFDPAKEIPGDRVEIELSWEDAGKRISKRAEDLIHNSQTKSAMSKGHWAYNGSQMVDGAFVAQKEGSLVSLISDPYALMNNPRVGRENDEIWSINEILVPPLKTPVEVVIRVSKDGSNVTSAAPGSPTP